MSDQNARQLIINDLDTNFIVDAGAGSGKTTSIVNRIFALLLKPVSFEHIVVITFTNKSAEELKQRIYEEFDTRLKDETLSQDKKKYLILCHENISQMFIGTIHSFSSEILKAFPIEAGLNFNFKTLDENEAKILKDEAWQEYLNNLFVSKKDKIEIFHKYNFKLDDIKKFFEKINQNSDIDFPTDEINEPDTKIFYKKCAEFLDANKNEICSGPVDSFTEWAQNRDDNANTKKKAQWILEIDKLEIKVTKWPDRKIAKKIKDNFEFFIEKYFELFLSDIRAYLYKEVIKIAKDAVIFYQKYKRQKNVIDFSDILLKTSILLKQNIEARNYFKDKYKYFFVDEFQDTDPLQTDIITSLASWLFIVGDPKQSIYRFRRADLNVYKQIKSDIKSNNGRELILTRNFRSCPEIVDWVNQTFSNIFSLSHKDYQADYMLMEAGKKDAKSGTIKKISLKDIKKLDDASKKSAEIIANYINSQVKEGKRKYSDFLILTFNKKRTHYFSEALQKIGIDCMSSGEKKDFSLILNDIKNLIELLNNPENEINCFSVLRSMLFGFSDNDLTYYRIKDNGDFNLINFNKKQYSKRSLEIINALNKLYELRLLFCEYSPACAFEIVLNKIGVNAIAELKKDSGKTSQQIRMLIEYIKSKEYVDYNNLDELAEFIGTLAQDNKLNDFDMEIDEGDFVRVMNLHKAKGLEAPVVILADPSGRNLKAPEFTVSRCHGDTVTQELPTLDSGLFNHRTSPQSEHIQDSRTSGLQDLIPDSGYIFSLKDALPKNWQKYQEQEKCFLNAEHNRLLYVAVTRAKEELIIVEYDNYRNPWQELNPYIEKSPELKVVSCESIANSCVTVSRCHSVTKTHDSRLRTPGSRLAAHSYELKSVSSDKNLQDKPEWIASGYGEEFGTLVHNLLNFIIKYSKNNWEKYASKLFKDIKIEVKFDLDKLIKHIENIIKSEFWKELLLVNEKYSEAPFSCKQDKIIIKGTIDLVYKKNNNWTIVDYKTDFVNKDNLDSFVKYYRPQILDYKKYWEELTCEKVGEAGLYFTNINKFVTI